jgi:hypothetical protein
VEREHCQQVRSKATKPPAGSSFSRCGFDCCCHCSLSDINRRHLELLKVVNVVCQLKLRDSTQKSDFSKTNVAKYAIGVAKAHYFVELDDQPEFAKLASAIVGIPRQLDAKERPFSATAVSRARAAEASIEVGLALGFVNHAVDFGLPRGVGSISRMMPL